MNLDVVVIDVLSFDGVLHSYYIRPVHAHGQVVVDRLSDIFPEYVSNDSKDYAGVRVYNSSKCDISRFSSKIKNFSVEKGGSIKFRFEHRGIPLGPSKNAHGGIYNFIVSPGWRLSELYMSDPYDLSTESNKMRKQFSHDVYWDGYSNTQLVEMQLRSGRGSFSFVVEGVMHYDDGKSVMQTIPSVEGEGFVSQVADNYLLEHYAERGGIDAVCSDMINKVEKADWLILKPSVFGFGIDLKAALAKINNFKESLKSKRRR